MNAHLDSNHPSPRATLGALAIAAVVASVGCMQGGASNGDEGRGSAASAARQDGGAGSAANHLYAPHPPTSSAKEILTASAGSVVQARLDTTLDSSTASVGDTVQATVTSDVRDAGGQVVLPSGTRLTGRISDVVSAKRVQKMSSVAFRFDRAILPDGTEVTMSASEVFDGTGWTKKQGTIIGGSAAGGAVLGQVIGHDTSSTVGGAIVGGAIAAGVIMSKKGEDIVLSSGSTMSLTLDGDVQVERPTTS